MDGLGKARKVVVYNGQLTNSTLVRSSEAKISQKNTIQMADMQNPYLAGTRTIQMFCEINASEDIAEQWRSAICKAVSKRLEQGLKIPVEITAGASLPAGGDRGMFGILNIEVNGTLNDDLISASIKWSTSIIMRGVAPEEEGDIVTHSISGDFQSDINDLANKLVNTIPFFNWRPYNRNSNTEG